MTMVCVNISDKRDPVLQFLGEASIQTFNELMSDSTIAILDDCTNQKSLKQYLEEVISILAMKCVPYGVPEYKPQADEVPWPERRKEADGVNKIVLKDPKKIRLDNKAEL